MFTRDNYKLYFQSAKYNSLKSDERTDLLYFTVSEIARQKGIPNVRLEFLHTKDHGLRGSMRREFDARGTMYHTLSLNEDVLTRKNAISYNAYNTICHELEHGSQNILIADENIKNSDPYVGELRANDIHYYNGEGEKGDASFELYQAQVKEMKAREAGLEGVKELIESNLKSTGEHDKAGELYLQEQAKKEYAYEKRILEKLGCHSREELAKAAMYGNPDFRDKDYKKILKSAREADFELFKKHYGGKYSEKELSKHFENNTLTPDYFKSQEFIKIKVGWKYNIPARDKNSQEDRAFFENALDNSKDIDTSEDRAFFEEIDKNQSAGPNLKEDRAFFENMTKKTEGQDQGEEKQDAVSQDVSDVNKTNKGQRR